MLIQQKFIVSLSNHLLGIEKNSKIIFGVRNIGEYLDELSKIGFPGLETGSGILPSAKSGRFSRFNSEGKEIILRSEPKELKYRQIYWTWTEWRGRGETEEMEGVKDISYYRYQRRFVPPPSIEFQIKNIGDEYVLISPVFDYNDANEEIIKLSINIFLEIFGFCEVFTENLEPYLGAPIRRLNWTILPPGERPWAQLKQQLQPIFSRARGMNKEVIGKRFQHIETFNAEFVAVGQGGFQGYVVFAFPKRNLFILESHQINNATYIFEDNWEHLSQLTKAEILNNDLQKDRIIHNRNWFNEISALI